MHVICGVCLPDESTQWIVIFAAIGTSVVVLVALGLWRYSNISEEEQIMVRDPQLNYNSTNEPLLVSVAAPPSSDHDGWSPVFPDIYGSYASAPASVHPNVPSIQFDVVHVDIRSYGSPPLNVGETDYKHERCVCNGVLFRLLWCLIAFLFE